MNKKGQALIEFVLILPVLIMIIFSIIDFGSIIVNKNQLENRINDVVELLKDTNEETKLREIANKGTNKNIELILSYDPEYLTIKLESEVNTITPGLNLILGSPYKINTERVVKYEE